MTDTMKTALGALAERRDAHRETVAALADLRKAHAEAGEKLKHRRAQFGAAAIDPVKAEKLAAQISTSERLSVEQARLLGEYQAGERAAQMKVHDAERVIVQLRGQRRDLEHRLDRSRGERLHLERKSLEAERAADARRDLLAQHDAVMGSVKAQLADVTELAPEAA